jgi:predicted alpha/beta hydrolase family esterase
MAAASVLLLPGWTGAGPEHWQSHWQRAHPEYCFVEQANWDTPTREDWLPTIGSAIDRAIPPVVLVAQSLGCIAAVEWATQADAATITRVAGAFLVAPSDVERKQAGTVIRKWRPISTNRLPFPSMLVASRTDPYTTFARSEQFAAWWGSVLIDVGDAGHINTVSGHGPWPEGHQLLTDFIAQIT